MDHMQQRTPVMERTTKLFAKAADAATAASDIVKSLLPTDVVYKYIANMLGTDKTKPLSYIMGILGMVVCAGCTFLLFTRCLNANKLNTALNSRQAVSKAFTMFDKIPHEILAIIAVFASIFAIWFNETIGWLLLAIVGMALIFCSYACKNPTQNKYIKFLLMAAGIVCLLYVASQFGLFKSFTGTAVSPATVPATYTLTSLGKIINMVLSVSIPLIITLILISWKSAPMSDCTFKARGGLEVYQEMAAGHLQENNLLSEKSE